MKRKRHEYSKVVTSLVVATFSLLAVGFVIFVCYEMHRTGNLDPVGHLAGPILGIPAAVIAFYMWRAKAKSQNDLEWEKTKQLTKFREKHPEYFIQGKIQSDVEDYDDLTGGEI